MISNIIGWILAIVIMICGWAFIANQNNKAIKAASKENQKNVDLAAEKAAIAATREFTKVADAVDSMKQRYGELPCTKASTYMLTQGRLMEKVDSLGTTQQRLEDKLDSFLMRLKDKN